MTTTIVLGLGATGHSCIRHLAERDRLFVFDTRPEPPCLAAVRRDFPGLDVLGLEYWRGALGMADRVLASPGIAPNHPLLHTARAVRVPISSDIEVFLDAAQAPVIGITGTNGKSTVTTLVGRLLAADGRNVAVGGNIGRPALDILDDERDAYVLELSSFQLERLRNPRLAVAALLNVSADHLDRHADLKHYAACKKRIFGAAERAVCNADDALTKPPAGVPSIAVNGDPRWRVEPDGVVIDGQRLATSALALRGAHNHFNVVAAAAIAHQAGVRIGAHMGVLAAFEGLPHRAQTVACVDGVTYVNDSKATNVGACRAALDGLGNGAGNIVLIAGGDAKEASFAPLAEAVARHVSTVVLLGRDAQMIARALGDAAPMRSAGDMGEAVRLARASARAGDTVLLAPACASFDMYANFEARGNAFAAEVRRLAKETTP